MANEADTCTKYVRPRLEEAGWNTDPHSYTEQRSFTDGRIVVSGKKIKRKSQKRTDFLLRYTRDFPIAVVEAKAEYKLAGDGLQQAKDYADILGIRFAYSTNGHTIIEFDFNTGLEREIESLPTPAELWNRLCESDGLTEQQSQKLLTAYNHLGGKNARYYQEIAINRSVQAILQGNKRILLTLATGTGKTLVSFQICWKLWKSMWNSKGEVGRKPRILFLADRNILVDDPKDKDFAPFGDARFKIENGEVNKGREMYFAIYQAIAEDERRPGLYKEYGRDFFDLIIIDECHRGSAREQSTWREILEYFAPAYQLGLTATPLRDDNRDSYGYFGNPIYRYSLNQGIQDGFLAPYRVRRVVTQPDAMGYRPASGETDRHGVTIPDRQYITKDFERTLVLRERTKAIAHHLTNFLKSTDRFAKTIIFCVDQEHADEMRTAIANLNSDLVKANPDYVARVTSEEGLIGKGFLSKFQDLEEATPVILTTSQLLTTGVDAPTCKNIAICRVINSMSEFKQIIGRGTRLREDYNKYYFHILDYTGSATTLFADPEFDGYPADLTQEELDEQGDITSSIVEEISTNEEEKESETTVAEINDASGSPVEVSDDVERVRHRKFYVDGGTAPVVAEMTYDLDVDGRRLSVSKITDFTAEHVRKLYPGAAEVRKQWANPANRAEIISLLEERGIDFEELGQAVNLVDADPLDLICHVAFNTPLRSRKERAYQLKTQRKEFFERYQPEARAVLFELLAKYADYGTTQFVLPESLKVAPISAHGNVQEIANLFGGAENLKLAIDELQSLLYAA